jgi:hypothetical protein
MEISENEVYTSNGKDVCEDCAMQAGLYPLGHTGARRDKISEKDGALSRLMKDKVACAQGCFWLIDRIDMDPDKTCPCWLQKIRGRSAKQCR